MAWKDNKNRPKFVTRNLAHAWQPYVDKMVRTFMEKGMAQIDAVDRALDLRDSHIKAGHTYKNGKIIK